MRSRALSPVSTWAPHEGGSGRGIGSQGLILDRYAPHEASAPWAEPPRGCRRSRNGWRRGIPQRCGPQKPASGSWASPLQAPRQLGCPPPPAWAAGSAAGGRCGGAAAAAPARRQAPFRAPPPRGGWPGRGAVTGCAALGSPGLAQLAASTASASTQGTLAGPPAEHAQFSEQP